MIDEVVAGSTAWLGRSLSCVCVQRKEGESRPSFDLTPAQVFVNPFAVLNIHLYILFVVHYRGLVGITIMIDYSLQCCSFSCC